MSPIKLSCIGHCCHDVTPSGYSLGGSVSYCSIIGQRLGAKVHLITSFGDDFEFLDRFIKEDITVYNQCAQHTTVFRNEYSGNKRTQYLLRRAENIALENHFNVEEGTDVMLIGTIADEVNLTQIPSNPEALIVGVIQGNLRQWIKEGLVISKEIDFSLLSKFDIVIVSEEDIAFIPHGLSKIRDHVAHLVITRGLSNASVYYHREEYSIPVFPVEVLDATGAGDTFAIAYTLEYFRTRDITQSAIFAHCASSIVIEHPGLHHIPERQEVLNRVREYKQLLSS